MVIIDTNNNVSGHLSVLKALGVTAIGRYYASNLRKRITRIEASAISTAGIDLFVVFENSGDPELSVESGVHDAQIALAQAQALGQPEGTAIYFALEHDKFGGYATAHIPGLKLYLEGVRQVLTPHYKAGVYGDGVVCKTALDAGLCEFTWLSASTKHPGTPEFTASGRATLIQGKRTPDGKTGQIDLDIDGLSVDFNIALKPDFGQFRLAAEQPAAAAEPARTSFAEAPVLREAATPAPAAPAPDLPGGWVFLVQRLREERRPGKTFSRTVGAYQVYCDGKPVADLSGTTVERQGPGDNGLTGKRHHRCIEAANYALCTHDTANYSTVDYETTGEHPRPAIEVGGAGRRTGILIHPASGYGSTIGCINLAGHIANANSDFSLADSTQRVIAVIEDLKSFNGGALSSGEGKPFANCRLVVRDAVAAHVAAAGETLAMTARVEVPRAAVPAGAALPSALADLKAAAQQLTASIERIAQLIQGDALAARRAGSAIHGAPLAEDAAKHAAPAPIPVPIATLTQLAANSKIASHNWSERGRAPLGYTKGLAVSYAELYCRLKANDPIVAAIAAPIDPNNTSDALAWYMARLKVAGMGDNDTPVKRLRHLFVLLTGLGMRESSGRYCEGRDRAADNVSSETAEAGLYQISFNLIGANRDLNAIFDRYEQDPDGRLDIFKEGVTCTASDLEHFGSPGERGYKFQELMKKCPAFAVELAARGLRLNRRHWGPINRREAELAPSCEDLFIAIEEAVDAAPPVHAEVQAVQAGTPGLAAAAPQPAPAPASATGGINLTASQRLVCERIINVFETGSIRGDYSDITIFNDGPNRIRQITYGRAQTTEYSHLRELVQMYVERSGQFAGDLKRFIPLIGQTALVDNATFKSLLRRAGREDPVMQQTQDVFFDRVYFQPALTWANEHGFTQALSMLVIYDSFIHSGGILAFLRARFREKPPVDGGDEKVWISEYVETRNNWLATASNELLHSTVYRTKCFMNEIARENWDLSRLPIVAHGVSVGDKGAADAGGVAPSPAMTARAYETFEAAGEETFGDEGPEIWGDDRFAESRGLAEAPAAETPMSAADIAEEILSSPRIQLATVHVSGVADEANAHQNMEDTAIGHAAHRSSYGTAPGGTVALNLSMLHGLLGLSERYSFAVSELCGGSHNPNSRHYAGVAFDVNAINGKPVRAGHPDLDAFKAMCRKLGATEVLGPGQPNHSTHVHAGWPRPQARMAMMEDSEAANDRSFSGRI